jgi:hypothetical protein
MLLLRQPPRASWRHTPNIVFGQPMTVQNPQPLAGRRPKLRSAGASRSCRHHPLCCTPAFVLHPPWRAAVTAHVHGSHRSWRLLPLVDGAADGRCHHARSVVASCSLSSARTDASDFSSAAIVLQDAQVPSQIDGPILAVYTGAGSSHTQVGNHARVHISPASLNMRRSGR